MSSDLAHTLRDYGEGWVGRLKSPHIMTKPTCVGWMAGGLEHETHEKDENRESGDENMRQGPRRDFEGGWVGATQVGNAVQRCDLII
jgi:hypothetical protein